MRSRTEILKESLYAKTFYGDIIELLLDHRDILLDIRDNKTSAGSPRAYDGEVYQKKFEYKPDPEDLPSLSAKPKKKKVGLFGKPKDNDDDGDVKVSYWERAAEKKRDEVIE